MYVVLRGQALRYLLDEPGERQPRYEQPRRIGATLVPPDLSKSLHMGPVSHILFLCVLGRCLVFLQGEKSTHSY